jgi:hypothetical protein
MPERNRFMKGLFAWSGFRQAAVEYDRVPRTVGNSKFRYWKLWTLALDGITSASTMPLRIWSYLGVLIALLALVYAIFLAVRTTLLGTDVPGYASIMVATLFLGGVQLISLGVLGEYVGRILVETKQRPIYVVRQRVGLEEPARLREQADGTRGFRPDGGAGQPPLVVRRAAADPVGPRRAGGADAAQCPHPRDRLRHRP